MYKCNYEEVSVGEESNVTLHTPYEVKSQNNLSLLSLAQCIKEIQGTKEGREREKEGEREVRRKKGNQDTT